MGGSILRGKSEGDPSKEGTEFREVLECGTRYREFVPICEYKTEGLRIELAECTEPEHCVKPEYCRGFED